MIDIYERAWKSVISPNKFTHTISTYCPKYQIVEGRKLQRIDFTLQNDQNKTISGIILKEEGCDPNHTILYLHGNGGSKLQCLGFTPLICKNRIAIISFDFVGCGNSDTGFLTYGINQSRDAVKVIKEAQKYFKFGKLIIWGRSMGAATAILMADANRKMIDSLVLDCPFRKLSNVIKRVMKNETSMPKSLVGVAFHFLSTSIHEKLNFSLFHLDYLEIYSKVGKSVPTLFLYSQNDSIVPKQQVFTFYESCKAQKQLVQIFQHHEQQRSLSVFDEGVQWVRQNKGKKNGKIKLSYLTESLQIEKLSIKSGTGFFCCTKM